MNWFWWLVAGGLLLLSAWLRDELIFLMGLFLGLTGAVSLLWARICLAQVTYTRRLGSHRLFAGEETDLAVEIVNAKPLPLAWLQADDEMPAALDVIGTQLTPSHRPNRVRLTNQLALRWYEKVTRRYRLRVGQRGVYRFGPVELVSGDIFGFVIKRAELEIADQLVVYPKVVPLTALGLPSRRPFGDLQTQRRVVEDPLRPVGVRAYAPGDSFRHIHWKATAHRQALQTKVFDPSASRPLAIFLNINTREHLYEGIDADLQEYAITAAASLARWAWENGHAVGLFVNSVAQSSAQRIRIRPRSHPEQLVTILEALARVITYGRWRIEQVLRAEAPHLPGGATIVVVTAMLNDALRRTLLDLRSREFGVVVVALGEAAQNPRLRGVQYYSIGGREEWHDLAALALAE